MVLKLTLSSTPRLWSAFREVLRRCGGRSPDFDARFARVPEFVALPPEQVLIERVAEEAAACALYCFWCHPDDYRAAVLEAVNTDGDSDSIATITGSLAGARVGLEGIPREWVAGVEQCARLRELGALLADARLLRSP